jgi:hypothetical protein
MQLLYPVESIQLKHICQLDPIGHQPMVWSYTNPDPLSESSGHMQIKSSWSRSISVPLLNPKAGTLPFTGYHADTITYVPIETYIGHTLTLPSRAYINSIPYLNPVQRYQLYPLSHIPIQIPLLNRNAITLTC